ncbi:MAG: imidazolonepropionase [Actinobacteria bacterium]|nr:imidazolonepropionase [Actinomycetota bacterium]
MGGAADVGGGSGAVVADVLVTARGPLPARGRALGEPETLRPGAVAWEDGAVTYVGPPEGFPEGSPERAGAGRRAAAVVPGFVDCHTHLPFAGWRADEWEARLLGRTYRDQHGEGGIHRSARMLAGASDDEVLAFCRPLLAEMLAHGTTAVELKTGYGLSVEGELRQGRLARRLAEEAVQTCTVTLLACHAVPPGWTREDWVDTVCRELIPAAAAEGLADAVDVYVEDIAFSVEDLRAVAGAADRVGLPLRCHADQLGPSGAAEAAAALGARSADHLNHAGTAGVAALARADTVAVLLPASTFSLRAGAPPARDLVDSGAAVALATDFNPGTSPVLSMPEALAMACTLYGLTPAEALVAATANAAIVLGQGDRLGTLEPGKRADLVLLDVEDVREVPYRPGHNPVVEVVVGGRSVGASHPGGGPG